MKAEDADVIIRTKKSEQLLRVLAVSPRRNSCQTDNTLGSMDGTFDDYYLCLNRNVALKVDSTTRQKRPFSKVIGLPTDFAGGAEPSILPTDAPGPAVDVNLVGVTPSLSTGGSLT